MRTLRHVPPRGSLHDQVACEMLIRERRRDVSAKTLEMKILGVAMGLQPGLIDAWSAWYASEVSHAAYTAKTLTAYKDIVTQAEKTRTAPDIMKKVDDLTVKDDDLRLPTREEREALLERLEAAKRRRRSAQKTPE